MSLFSERLKSARIMAGFTLQELSDAMDGYVSKQALNKYELGENTPGEDVIDQLCKALNVRPDYFRRERQVILEGLEFRKLSKYPAKEKAKAIQQAQDILERYLDLEEILGIDSRFINPIQDFREIKTLEDVEDASILVRSVWGLGNKGPLGSVIEILEDHEIKMVEVSVEKGFDGSQGTIYEKLPVIVLNRNDEIPKDRIRFSALHELAHLVLHINSEADHETKEKFCHYFAGAMLLPKEAAIMEFGPKRTKILFKELASVKLQYGISIQALIYRLFNLGIITKSYFNSLYFMMGQLNMRATEPYPYEGSEKSNRFIQLLFRALAEEVISTGKAASLNRQSVAEFQREHL
nr:XRE family transcriptional regulator [Pseudobdellovibrionaceae bacterium]